jgi:hypothetical protein
MYSGDSLYSGSSAVLTQIVTPVPLTITASNESKVYGQTVTFAGTEFTTAGLVNGDKVTSVTLSSSGAAAAATVAGSPYVITASNAVGSGLGNYSISYADGTLKVTPAALTITASNESKTYGDAFTPDGGTQFTAAGLGNGDSVSSVTLSSAGYAATAPVAGSPYVITASNAVGSGLGNYSISYVNGTLTITPATLTVAANAQTKAYGDSDPALTYVVSGLRFSDSEAQVLSGLLTRAAGEAVGSYLIDQGSLAANANYSLSFQGNDLTITPATLTISANAQTKVYGDADPTLSYQVSGLKFSDAEADVLTGLLHRAAGENVGAYAIDQGSLAANANYSLSFQGNDLTITPATLTVTAKAQTKAYGDADPALTYVVSGLRFSDSEAQVLSGLLTRAAGENVGSYAIDQGSLAANANYSLSFQGNDLTITPATLTVTANAQTKVYGDSDPALTYNITSGNLVGSDAFSGALSRASGENVGTYAIGQGSLSAGGNYTIVYVGANLAITARPVTGTGSGHDDENDTASAQANASVPDADVPAIPILLFPAAEARLIPAAGPTLYPAPTPTAAVFAAFTPPRVPLLSSGTVADNLIEGTVFLDANLNGQRDEGEPGLGNVRVLLEMEQEDGTYATVKSQITARDGHYLFAALAPGKYRVRLEVSPEMLQTFPDESTGYSVQSEMLQTFPAESTGYSVQLLGSTKALDRDFGLSVSAASAFLGRSLTEAARATIAAQEKDARPEPGATVDLVFQHVSDFPTRDGAGRGRSGSVEPAGPSDNELVRPGPADENSALASSSEADGAGDQTAASWVWRGALAGAGGLLAALGALIRLHGARGAAHEAERPAKKENHRGRRV